MESTNGAIKVNVEHCKWGGLGRRVSNGAFLSVWRHKIKCNNENLFDKKKLPYLGVPDERDTHQGIMFTSIKAVYLVLVFFIYNI